MIIIDEVMRDDGIAINNGDSSTVLVLVIMDVVFVNGAIGSIVAADTSTGISNR